MEEYLAEISGTLARTAQRKNTILSQVHKQAQRSKKEALYGFAVRPQDPSLVQDVKAAKHFLNEVRGEIGHHTSRMLNPNLISIEKDGEVVVRQANTMIHRLIIERNRWIVRLKELGGELTEDERHIFENEINGVRVKRNFFGCAAELPEAKAMAQAKEAKIVAARERQSTRAKKRGRDQEHEEDEELAVASSSDKEEEEGSTLRLREGWVAHEELSVSSGNSAVDAYLRRLQDVVATATRVTESGTLSPHEVALRALEAKTEAAIRRKYAATSQQHVAPAPAAEHAPSSGPQYILDYCADGTGVPSIPSDAEVKKMLFEKKKAAMKAQLSMLSNGAQRAAA